MSGIKCFLLEDMKVSRYWMRRYVGSLEAKCPLPQGYHNALSASFEDRPDDPARSGLRVTNPPPMLDKADERWPKACACGYIFAPEDKWQVFGKSLYRFSDAVMTWDDAPAGAIIDASWWPDKGADGHAWTVKLPGGGEWMTESSASNCKCPDDPKHRCWTRTGVVPRLTVTPSIWWNSPNGWHGYLRDGVLVSV